LWITKWLHVDDKVTDRELSPVGHPVELCWTSTLHGDLVLSISEMRNKPGKSRNTDSEIRKTGNVNIMTVD